MNEYFMSIFAVCACFGILGLISYDEKSRAERAALGIVFLYVILSPIAENWKDFDLIITDVDDVMGEYRDEGYSEIGEAALCDGICRAISEEFSLSEDDVFVRVQDFDFVKMKGETVSVLLSGKAAFCDSRAVKKFVDEMGVGKCEIEISIGG